MPTAESVLNKKKNIAVLGGLSIMDFKKKTNTTWGGSSNSLGDNATTKNESKEKLIFCEICWFFDVTAVGIQSAFAVIVQSLVL